jgi:hypothetical protein
MTHEMRQSKELEAEARPRLDGVSEGLVSRSESAEEMARVAPVLKALGGQKAPVPTAAQWRAFSDQLERQVTAPGKLTVGERFSALRDALSATDSTALRAAAVVAIAAAVALAGLAAWVVWHLLQGGTVTTVVPMPAPSVVNAGLGALMLCRAGKRRR